MSAVDQVVESLEVRRDKWLAQFLLESIMFIDLGIKENQKTEKYKNGKGIHVMYSGYLNYMKNRHNLSGQEVIELVNELVEKKKLQSHRCKGGAMIFKYGDMKITTRPDIGSKMDEALAKMAE